MTNTSHTNCSHDNTKSARAKCRKARAAASRPIAEAPMPSEADLSEYRRLVAICESDADRYHCTLCGHEVKAADDPYTKCCNEPMMPINDHSECGEGHGHPHID